VIVHSRIEGAQLAGNLLGDPTERDLFVYLPPGYDGSDSRYPTAYLLHALGSSAQLEVTPEMDRMRWQPPLEDILDPNRNVDQAFRTTQLALKDGRVVAVKMRHEF